MGERWGNGVQAVAMNDEHVKTLVAAIVEGVTEASKGDLIEQYKRAAHQEAELTRARETEAHLRAEVASLLDHIGVLNGILTSMPAGRIHRAQVPLYQDRYAATVPLPASVVPVQGYSDSFSSSVPYAPGA